MQAFDLKYVILLPFLLIKYWQDLTLSESKGKPVLKGNLVATEAEIVTPSHTLL